MNYLLKKGDPPGRQVPPRNQGPGEEGPVDRAQVISKEAKDSTVAKTKNFINRTTHKYGKSHHVMRDKVMEATYGEQR